MIRRTFLIFPARSLAKLVAAKAANIRAQINAFDAWFLFIGIWFLVVEDCLDFDPGWWL